MSGYTANEKVQVLDKILIGGTLSVEEEKIASQGRLRVLMQELKKAEENTPESYENKKIEP